jgi:Flp pilus assembly protein TadG
VHRSRPNVTLQESDEGSRVAAIGVGMLVQRGGGVFVNSRGRQGRRHSERGAAAVELALVLPILLLLVFGIVEFGRSYNIQISLTGAAREGARVMAIQNDPAAARAATISATAINPPPSVSVTPSTCTAGATVTVTATRDVTYNIPFFGSQNLELRGIGVMRCGG